MLEITIEEEIIDRAGQATMNIRLQHKLKKSTYIVVRPPNSLRNQKA